jgi:hypothetical protein
MIIKKLNYKISRMVAIIQKKWMGRRQEVFMDDLQFSECCRKFVDRTTVYEYMYHYFIHRCPQEVREHRKYFQQDSRGFGEDAFHGMWYLLLREFQPENCLEIGVYRGQTISLWALLSRYIKFNCNISGISPFTPVGDGVSVYKEDLNYLDDTLRNHSAFDLPRPNLIKALSNECTAIAAIKARSWDLIYIDGNHDYDVALGDYEICLSNLAVGGLLVMDDSSLYTDFRGPIFSFAGHPGPSRIVQERAMRDLKFLGAVGHNNIFIKQKRES